MPVTDDQPVSVGNLNAVLGGGPPSHRAGAVRGR